MSNTATSGEHAVSVPVDGVRLAGRLCIPTHPAGIVVATPGSGLGHPERCEVSALVRGEQLATFDVALLTPSEEMREFPLATLRYDVGLLARRLASVTEWLGQRVETRPLRVGYLAAGPDVPAALQAAAWLPHRVRAVVGVGGRPDLAGRALREVRAATLLLVADEARPLLEGNATALGEIPGVRGIVVIPGASRLVEDAGVRTEVGLIARDWLARYLVDRETPDQGLRVRRATTAPSTLVG